MNTTESNIAPAASAPVQGLPDAAKVSAQQLGAAAVLAAGQQMQENVADLVRGIRPARTMAAIAKDQGRLLKEEGSAILRTLNPFAKSKGTFLKVVITLVYLLVFAAIGAAATYHHKIGQHIGAETEIGENVTYWVTVAKETSGEAKAAYAAGELDRALDLHTQHDEAWMNAWNHTAKPGVFRRAASAVFGR